MKYSLLLVAVVLVSVASIGAGIYKWVDEKGVTHYSDAPAPDQKAKKIEVSPAPEVTPKPEASPKSWEQKGWEQKEREFQQRRIEAEEAEKKLKEQEAEAKVREIKCSAAKSNLRTLQIDRPVYWINKHGERVFLDDAERKAAIEKANQEIESFCKRSESK
ncbi:MAG: DUF4124 domain-containing protein [Anaerolineae bacterium]|nr:DUF4124 domain-containing protein [Anaerolineae bacterium]